MVNKSSVRNGIVGTLQTKRCFNIGNGILSRKEGRNNALFCPPQSTTVDLLHARILTRFLELDNWYSQYEVIRRRSGYCRCTCSIELLKSINKYPTTVGKWQWAPPSQHFLQQLSDTCYFVTVNVFPRVPTESKQTCWLIIHQQTPTPPSFSLKKSLCRKMTISHLPVN